MVYIPPRVPDPRKHNARIEALAARYRGRCITCGRRSCSCGDGFIGIYSGPSTSHYGYRLDEQDGQLRYTPVPEELRDVRRVFQLYARCVAANRVSQHLAAHGHQTYGREWILRILRCPIHLEAGSIDEDTYTRAKRRLSRKRR